MTAVKPLNMSELTKRAEAADRAAVSPISVMAFNNLLTEAKRRQGGERFTITREEAVAEILRLLNNAQDEGEEPIGRSHVFDNRMLDVEIAFADVGWSVEYYKPAAGYQHPEFIFIWRGK